MFQLWCDVVGGFGSEEAQESQNCITSAELVILANVRGCVTDHENFFPDALEC